jgi:catechol 2,3-dioxygenase-like lactoylglutathione lyase family enzyme
MAVKFLKHVALEIPEQDCDKAIEFYTAFGLELRRDSDKLGFACQGRRYESLILIPRGEKKQLHHVAMGTDDAGLDSISANLKEAGIEVLPAPEGFESEGIWFRNLHGLLFNIITCTEEREVSPERPFLINSPGHYNRINAGAMPPKSELTDVAPRKLGHSLLFTPNLQESIDFLINILGMRLSDRAQDAVAFLHCQGGSDHHVIALAQSSSIGFHHASFMLASPDEVGLGGRQMIDKGYEKGWGFGRHAIGSNFFHYVQDPWGSYIEYYADIDYIDDGDNWIAQNWPLEDSLFTWGPNPPEDFVRNYEAA